MKHLPNIITALRIVGSILDIIADLLFVACCAIQLLPILSIPSWLWIWAGIIVIIKIVNQIDRMTVLPYSPDNQLVHHSHCNRSDNSYFCSNSGRIHLALSFQFHHTQMNGVLVNLHNEINRFLIH